MLGADYSTKFSPWLAAGCLSPRIVADQLKKYEAQEGANKSTYWIVFELLWRDFFSFYARKHGSRIFAATGVSRKGGVRWRHGPAADAAFRAWIEEDREAAGRREHEGAGQDRVHEQPREAEW